MNSETENPLTAADNTPVYKEPSRAMIQIKAGGLSEEASQAEEALINAGVQIYQRDSRLVRPVILNQAATKNRQTKIALLVELTREYLIDQLCQYISWQKYSNNDWINANPPKAVAEIILNRFGDWKFPVITGVITTPTLRYDGSILDKIGYDKATGLLLIEPPALPNIPDNPTKQDALKALATLEELLVEFPFTNEESKSVALSAFITPIVRGSMIVAPMHIINSSTPGTGKSYLSDVMAAIAIGHYCPVIAAGRDEAETEKRLGAALISGQSIISIDNFNGDLGGDGLCQFIERPTVNIRPLQTSKQIRVDSKSTIFVTGNNIRMINDMNRRIIMATLDANQERPEKRQFRNNPVEMVLADRGKYIAAALIIVRAYIVAERPDKVPKLASFGEWSDNVRSALIWLGKSDPVETMEVARSEDPFLQTFLSVLHAIKITIGFDKRKTASEIIDIALKERDSGRPNLHEALVAAVDNKKDSLTSKELGTWLARRQNRILKGIRLCKFVDKHGHAAVWWIEQAVSAVESG